MPKLLITAGFLIFKSYGGGAVVKPSQQYLWHSVSGRGAAAGGRLTVQFQCETDRTLLVDLILKNHKGLLKQKKSLNNRWAVSRWQVGNVPPSGQGYKEFVYPVRIQQGGERFAFPPSQLVKFKTNLQELKTQTLKNRQQALREYQEKVDYCQKRPLNRAGCKKDVKVCETRQKCFQSLSGYQPGNPSVTLSVEYPGQKFYFVFDPTGLQNLKKLKCHRAGS